MSTLTEHSLVLFNTSCSRIVLSPPKQEGKEKPLETFTGFLFLFQCGKRKGKLPGFCCVCVFNFMTDLSEHFERAQCHFFALKGDEESFDLQVAVADTHRAIISRDRAALYSKNEELSDFSTDILKMLIYFC